jgi:imidazolonepropionase-like amidohydrolase
MSTLRLSLVALLVTVPLSAQQPALVIEHVTLIDGNGGPPVANATIVIDGKRIKEVGAGNVEIPRGARRIDGKGKYVIPGLMDMHVHLRGGPSEDALSPSVTARGLSALHSYLYCGVTTIYDIGNDPDYIFSFREKERAGEIVAPRIFASGNLVTAPNGHGEKVAVTVEDWAIDREKIDAHIAREPDMVKFTQDEHGWGDRSMINNMPLDLLERVIRYYHEHGIRTTIHASNELRTWEAIYAGVDTLAHPVIQAPVSDRYLKMMKVKKIPQLSTLTIGESYSRLAEHPEFLDQPLYRATVDPKEILRLKTEESKKQAERRWTWWMKVMTPVAQENLRRLNEVGGVVGLGTDQSLGAAVHRELELLVEGGISPGDTIKIATKNSAIFLGKESELGTIEPGKLADVVILNADPTKDINNAKLIHTVIKDGRIIDRGSLQIPANASGTE